MKKNVFWKRFFSIYIFFPFNPCVTSEFSHRVARGWDASDGARLQSGPWDPQGSWVGIPGVLWTRARAIMSRGRGFMFPGACSRRLINRCWSNLMVSFFKSHDQFLFPLINTIFKKTIETCVDKNIAWSRTYLSNYFYWSNNTSKIYVL